MELKKTNFIIFPSGSEKTKNKNKNKRKNQYNCRADLLNDFYLQSVCGDLKKMNQKNATMEEKKLNNHCDIGIKF